MKKFLISLCFLSFLSLSISGCAKENKSLCAYRAVVGIDIVTKANEKLLRRHYTDAKKMQYVLTFLRLLKPIGKPDENPDQLTEDMFLIVLTRSDGSQVFYRQTSHRYFCKNDEDWFSVDPMQAVKLYELMAHIPGDNLQESSSGNFVKCADFT